MFDLPIKGRAKREINKLDFFSKSRNALITLKCSFFLNKWNVVTFDVILCISQLKPRPLDPTEHSDGLTRLQPGFSALLLVTARCPQKAVDHNKTSVNRGRGAKLIARAITGSGDNSRDLTWSTKARTVRKVMRDGKKSCMREWLKKEVVRKGSEAKTTSSRVICTVGFTDCTSLQFWFLVPAWWNPHSRVETKETRNCYSKI